MEGRLMNVPLRELTVLLEQELYRLHYGRQTIRYYRRMWHHLIAFAEQEGVDHFTEDLGMRFLDSRYNFSELEKAGTLTQSIVNVFRVVRMIGDFQQHGSILRRYYKHKELLHQDGYKAILQNYEDHCRQREYARATRKHYRDTTEQFLSYLESHDVRHIADSTGKEVAGYINTLLGYTYKTVELQLCALRSFFRYLFVNELHRQDLAETIPSIKARKQSRIPSVWTHDTVTRMLDVIDRGNPAGKRDYAMILLGARLGLRTMDIKHLKLDNLKWQNNRIEFMQSKTSRMQSLPLLPDVGWAIIDYLKNGRPKVDSPLCLFAAPCTAGTFLGSGQAPSDRGEIHEVGQNPSLSPEKKACIPSATRWQAGCLRRTRPCPSSRIYWGTLTRIRQRSISRWTLPCCANAR